MNEPMPDELFWELPRAQGRDDGAAPHDDVLIAYRGGSLASSEQARVEWDLAGSRRGRTRLAELAGVRIDAPPRIESGRRRWTAAAAALAATILIAAVLVLQQQRGDGAPLPIPEFSLRVEGLAGTRDEPGAATSLPDGTVRVVVEPTGAAIAGLHFALYRAEGAELIRLAEPAEVTVDSERGSAVLTAAAERLVGAKTGTRPFFVVVADRAPLPGRVAAQAEAPQAALEAASGGRAYRVTLTILDRTEGAP